MVFGFPSQDKANVWRLFKETGLVITGVCNSRMQAAIIADDVYYYVGDAAKGFTITEINKNGVELRRGPGKMFKMVSPM